MVSDDRQGTAWPFRHVASGVKVGVRSLAPQPDTRIRCARMAHHHPGHSHSQQGQHQSEWPELQTHSISQTAPTSKVRTVGSLASLNGYASPPSPPSPLRLSHSSRAVEASGLLEPSWKLPANAEGPSWKLPANVEGPSWKLQPRRPRALRCASRAGFWLYMTFSSRGIAASTRSFSP